MGMIASYNAGGGYDNEYEQDKSKLQSNTKRGTTISSTNVSGPEDNDSGEDIYSSVRSQGGAGYNRVKEKHWRGESGYESWPQARPTGEEVHRYRYNQEY